MFYEAVKRLIVSTEYKDFRFYSGMTSLIEFLSYRVQTFMHCEGVLVLCQSQGSLNANTDKGRTGLRNLGNTVRMH